MGYYNKERVGMTTSKRYKEWYEADFAAVAALPPKEVAPSEPRSQFILWVMGGRSLFDTDMLGEANLNFCWDEEWNGNWAIRVSGAREALLLANRITGCIMLGLCELEDGTYYEWEDYSGKNIDHEDVDVTRPYVDLPPRP